MAPCLQELFRSKKLLPISDSFSRARATHPSTKNSLQRKFWRLHPFSKKNKSAPESLQRLERRFDGHAPAHARIDIVDLNTNGVQDIPALRLI